MNYHHVNLAELRQYEKILKVKFKIGGLTVAFLFLMLRCQIKRTNYIPKLKLLALIYSPNCPIYRATKRILLNKKLI